MLKTSRFFYFFFFQLFRKVLRFFLNFGIFRHLIKILFFQDTLNVKFILINDNEANQNCDVVCYVLNQIENKKCK